MVSESFFRYLQYEKRFSGHTLTAYQTDLQQFSDFLFIQFELKEIEKAPHTFIRSWIVQLMDQGIGNRSINRKISTLKSFYKFLQREGIIEQTPMQKVTGPKTSKKLPLFVEEQHMVKLLDEQDFEDNFSALRDRVILEVFYATGMRVSELTGLKESNVDINQGTIKVLGKRNKERIIPISDEFAEVLRNYINIKNKQATTEYLFIRENGQQIYNQMVYRMVRRELGNVTTIGRKSPHILRHTFATHMLNNGAELNAIKEILGHSSLSATQVYTHNSVEKLKQIYKQAHPKG